MEPNIKATAQSQLKNIIIEAFAKALADEKFEKKPMESFTIETPSDPKNGDLSTNCAMMACKTFRKNPLECAQILSEYFDLKDSYFERFEIKKPGFINFFYNADWFSEVLSSVIDLKSNFGKTQKRKGLKYVVEYVSANPTGPMHIGNARGGAIGDVISEILKWTGAECTREFYLNDAGNQIEKFKKSLSIRYLNLFGKNIEFDEDLYKGEDIIELAKRFKEIYGDKYADTDEKQRQNALVEFALPLNVQNLKDDLKKYRVEFDNWFKESSLHSSHKIDEIVNKLKDKGATYQKEGALWFKTTNYGCEKDDVLVRASGIPTYFAADIAYHYDKLKTRTFDYAINVWGADHHGHVNRLKAAINALNQDGDRINIVLMQMVRLIKDGEHVKLSKRSGKAVTLDDLLEMVPIDAARFFFNLRQPSSHFDFDLDLAIKNTSQNPVYYVQYAHARICSIFKKLKINPPYELGVIDFKTLTLKEEKSLVRLISSFPNEIIKASNELDPSRITKYAYDLANNFHKFYTVCNIKNSQPSLLKARLGLCLATKITLKNLLDILKVDAKVSM